MAIRNLHKHVAAVVPLMLFTSVAYLNITLGEENPYKHEKFEKRSQNSAMHQFNTGLSRTINDLDQKADNLEAMNQNLEGRINMLASEKDKLNKAYAQMKAKQSALEKEHATLKKKTTSLEVAYKKMSSKSKVATTTKKTTSTAKKTSVAKSPQKSKTSTKATSTSLKSSDKKVSSSSNIEDTSNLQSYPPPAGKISEEQKGERVGGIDVKKFNEKGIEYGKKGMYEEAIKEFQKVAAIEPNMANVHYNLGLAYKKKGMLSEAEKEFAEYERLKKQEN
jgi:tetratricopeptide (TPR) repeat protein